MYLEQFSDLYELVLQVPPLLIQFVHIELLMACRGNNNQS